MVSDEILGLGLKMGFGYKTLHLLAPTLVSEGVMVLDFGESYRIYRASELFKRCERSWLPFGKLPSI